LKLYSSYTGLGVIIFIWEFCRF